MTNAGPAAVISSLLGELGLTAADLAALAEKYTPASEQRCRICGTPLRLQGPAPFPGGAAVYTCPSPWASPDSPAGPQAAAQHRQNSTWLDRGTADARVLAMLTDVVRRLEERERRATDTCLATLEEHCRDTLAGWLGDYTDPMEGLLPGEQQYKIVIHGGGTPGTIRFAVLPGPFYYPSDSLGTFEAKVEVTRVDSGAQDR